MFHTGPLLSDIRQHLVQKVEYSKTDHNVLVYSGHDVTVVSLWRALGFAELLEPEYGSSIVIELHEELEPEAFYVKVFCYLTFFFTKSHKNEHLIFFS